MSLKGIDVSEHNGVIDWEKVKSQIDFAIIRLGWIGNRKNHTLDNQFIRNYEECKRLNIPLGVYVFNYCTSEEKAKDGANWVLEQLSDKTLELPVYIDMEDDVNQSKPLHEVGIQELTDIVIGFNSVIETTNRWAGVYANKDWFTNYLHKNILSQMYTCWVAYPDSGELDFDIGNKDMWQNSFKGKIDGINAPIINNEVCVDLDILNRDLISEIGIYKKEENKEIKESQTILKSNEEIANEVIDGLWGNDEERRNRLSEAGYNYNEVQAIVNEKMKENDFIIHTVKRGENLTIIARKYNTKWNYIYNENRDIIGNNPNLIKVGQKLKIRK